MAISGGGIRHDRETTFEIITNLETIFAGAFLQDDDDDAVDEVVAPFVRHDMYGAMGLEKQGTLETIRLRIASVTLFPASK